MTIYKKEKFFYTNISRSLTVVSFTGGGGWGISSTIWTLQSTEYGDLHLQVRLWSYICFKLSGIVTCLAQTCIRLKVSIVLGVDVMGSVVIAKPRSRGLHVWSATDSDGVGGGAMSDC